MVGWVQKRGKISPEDTCQQCAQFRSGWAIAVAARSLGAHVQLVDDEVGSRDLVLEGISAGTHAEVGASDEGASVAAEDALAQLSDLVTMRLLSPLEADVLRAAFRVLREGGRVSWRRVGRLVPCRHQRARQLALRALHRWHTSVNRTDRLRIFSEMTVSRVQGSRTREVVKRHVQQLGNRQIAVGELVTDAKVRGRLLRGSPASHDRARRPYPERPMRELLDALVRTVATPTPGQPFTSTPAGKWFENSPDWSHNVRWAERKLHRTRLRSKRTPVTFREALLELARGCQPCGNCRTPILAGCRIEGRRINQGRQFCDGACKMQAQRRSRDQHRKVFG